MPSLRHHLDLLRSASSTVTSRLNAAHLADPDYLAWQSECRELEDEWQRAMNSDDRTASLLAFAERHHTG